MPKQKRSGLLSMQDWTEKQRNITKGKICIINEKGKGNTVVREGGQMVRKQHDD